MFEGLRFKFEVARDTNDGTEHGNPLPLSQFPV